MLRALIYKEWIKLRWPVLVFGLLAAASIIDWAITLRYHATAKDAVDLWSSVIVKQRVLYTRHLDFALVCGLLMGAFQWFPETRKRRLRLLLHLPVNEMVSIPVVVATGLGLVLTLVTVHTLAIALVYGYWFPQEVVNSLFTAFAPRILAGVSLYCGAAMVLMETSWVRRVTGALLVFGFCKMLCEVGAPGLYAEAIFRYGAVTFLLPWMLFLPVMRAKRGGA